MTADTRKRYTQAVSYLLENQGENVKLTIGSRHNSTAIRQRLYGYHMRPINSRDFALLAGTQQALLSERNLESAWQDKHTGVFFLEYKDGMRLALAATDEDGTIIKGVRL